MSSMFLSQTLHCRVIAPFGERTQCSSCRPLCWGQGAWRLGPSRCGASISAIVVVRGGSGHDGAGRLVEDQLAWPVIAPREVEHVVDLPGNRVERAVQLDQMLDRRRRVDIALIVLITVLTIVRQRARRGDGEREATENDAMLHCVRSRVIMMVEGTREKRHAITAVEPRPGAIV